MTGAKNCWAIYAHFSRASGAGPKYYLLYVFTDQGLVDRDDLEKVYVESFDDDVEDPEYIGPFEGLSSLGHFSQSLCREIELPQIILVSQEAYNKALEASTTAGELLEEMTKAGQTIPHPEGGKKGLFGKIFS